MTGASRGIGAATGGTAARPRARACVRRRRARDGRSTSPPPTPPSGSPSARRRAGRHPRQQRRDELRQARSTTLTDEDWHGQWELHVMALDAADARASPRHGRARLGADRQRRLLRGQAPVADERRLLGDQGRAALALARVRRHLRARRACSSTPSPRARSRARCGWARAAWPTRPPRRRGISREEALDGPGGQGPARALRRPGGDRVRRRLPVLRARRRWSPAPRGRSTAAPSPRSSERALTGCR